MSHDPDSVPMFVKRGDYDVAFHGTPQERSKSIEKDKQLKPGRRDFHGLKDDSVASLYPSILTYTDVPTEAGRVTVVPQQLLRREGPCKNGSHTKEMEEVFKVGSRKPKVYRYEPMSHDPDSVPMFVKRGDYDVAFHGTPQERSKSIEKDKQLKPGRRDFHGLKDDSGAVYSTPNPKEALPYAGEEGVIYKLYLKKESYTKHKGHDAIPHGTAFRSRDPRDVFPAGKFTRPK
ncbi:unnamed protein product [Darwinula stevensoni]|uniref:Uncharacterized protein n=1 Tax=Darwinula stevensoni TaxID=69355 RepID=A0A7R9A9X8_9CRUS|nr:unnamed protein product [Darwinula stevensoni]CAG0897869.1 unnamed protein product [Darwinula stevensoni]